MSFPLIEDSNATTRTRALDLYRLVADELMAARIRVHYAKDFIVRRYPAPVFGEDYGSVWGTLKGRHFVFYRGPTFWRLVADARKLPQDWVPNISGVSDAEPLGRTSLVYRINTQEALAALSATLRSL